MKKLVAVIPAIVFAWQAQGQTVVYNQARGTESSMIAWVKTTGEYVKYKGVQGPPGTQETIITLKR